MYESYHVKISNCFIIFQRFLLMFLFLEISTFSCFKKSNNKKWLTLTRCLIFVIDVNGNFNNVGQVLSQNRTSLLIQWEEALYNSLVFLKVVSQWEFLQEGGENLGKYRYFIITCEVRNMKDLPAPKVYRQD